MSEAEDDHQFSDSEEESEGEKVFSYNYATNKDNKRESTMEETANLDALIESYCSIPQPCYSERARGLAQKFCYIDREAKQNKFRGANGRKLGYGDKKQDCSVEAPKAKIKQFFTILE